jgi:four helix bundle protein
MSALMRVNQLEIWREAMEIVGVVYQLSNQFPKSEVYGLTSQMRRAAVSIPAHLAEGVGRGGNAELARFAQIAVGSAYELDTLIQLARNLEYVPSTEIIPLQARLETLIKRTIYFMNKVRPSTTVSPDL